MRNANTESAVLHNGKSSECPLEGRTKSSRMDVMQSKNCSSNSSLSDGGDCSRESA